MLGTIPAVSGCRAERSSETRQCLALQSVGATTTDSAGSSSDRLLRSQRGWHGGFRGPGESAQGAQLIATKNGPNAVVVAQYQRRHCGPRFSNSNNPGCRSDATRRRCEFRWPYSEMSNTYPRFVAKSSVGVWGQESAAGSCCPPKQDLCVFRPDARSPRLCAGAWRPCARD